MNKVSNKSLFFFTQQRPQSPHLVNTFLIALILIHHDARTLNTTTEYWPGK